MGATLHPVRDYLSVPAGTLPSGYAHERSLNLSEEDLKSFVMGMEQDLLSPRSPATQLRF